MPAAAAAAAEAEAPAPAALAGASTATIVGGMPCCQSPAGWSDSSELSTSTTLAVRSTTPPSSGRAECGRPSGSAARGGGTLGEGRSAGTGGGARRGGGGRAAAGLGAVVCRSEARGRHAAAVTWGGPRDCECAAEDGRWFASAGTGVVRGRSMGRGGGGPVGARGSGRDDGCQPGGAAR